MQNPGNQLNHNCNFVDHRLVEILNLAMNSNLIYAEAELWKNEAFSIKLYIFEECRVLIKAKHLK